MKEQQLPLLLFCSFATASSNSVVFASMSELQAKYGYPDSSLGLIAGTGFAVGLIVQLFLAPLADRGHGPRLIKLGLCLAGLGSLVFVLGESLTYFVIGRGIVGASIGCTFPAVRALSAHLDQNRSAERLGAVAGTEIAGFVSGPLFGSLIIDPIGLDATFLVFGGLAIVALLIISPRHFPKLTSTSESKKPSLELLGIPSIRVALILTLAINFPVGMFDALWDRFLDDIGGNNAMTGLTFAVYGLPFLLLSPIAGRFIDRKNPIAIVLLFIVPISLLNMTYGFLKAAWFILILGLIEGSLQAVAAPASMAAIAKAAPIGRAAAAQGLSGSINVFGQMVAAFIAPTIYGRFGAQNTFILFGLGIGLVALIGAVMNRGLSQVVQ